ncbi:hypothetical protein, partial [Pseudomonas sp. 10S4]|uniref:hypothetical protein n=1 Tax=Pseudomonas sp. 10S4 TaxID=3048583 RepID=UPI002B22E561
MDDEEFAGAGAVALPSGDAFQKFRLEVIAQTGRLSRQESRIFQTGCEKNGKWLESLVWADAVCGQDHKTNVGAGLLAKAVDQSTSSLNDT